jgi:hypothetical protein
MENLLFSMCSTDNLLLLTTAVMGGTLILLAWFYWLPYLSYKQDQWLPYGPCMMMQAIPWISGLEAPFILLWWAWQMNHYPYWLPLPIGWNGVFVIADLGLTCAILRDISTGRSVHFYCSFEGLTGWKIMFTCNKSDGYMKTMCKSMVHAFFRNHIGCMNCIVVQHFQQRMTECDDNASGTRFLGSKWLF